MTSPATVRKAATLVEKLDRVLDEFGARLVQEPKPIRFELIGTDGTVFEAVPVNDDDVNTPTELQIGFVR